jgi:hypothetical protein
MDGNAALSAKQLAFLSDLRAAARPARADLDATMIGPLLRAGLVRWGGAPEKANGSTRHSHDTFVLTRLGARRLADYKSFAQSA